VHLLIADMCVSVEEVKDLKKDKHIWETRCGSWSLDHVGRHGTRVVIIAHCPWEIYTRWNVWRVNLRMRTPDWFAEYEEASLFLVECNKQA